MASLMIGGESERDEESEHEQRCFRWDESGECSYGDRCRFTHASERKHGIANARARTRGSERESANARKRTRRREREERERGAEREEQSRIDEEVLNAIADQEVEEILGETRGGAGVGVEVSSGEQPYGPYLELFLVWPHSCEQPYEVDESLLWDRSTVIDERHPSDIRLLQLLKNGVGSGAVTEDMIDKAMRITPVRMSRAATAEKLRTLACQGVRAAAPRGDGGRFSKRSEPAMAEVRVFGTEASFETLRNHCLRKFTKVEPTCLITGGSEEATAKYICVFANGTVIDKTIFSYVAKYIPGAARMVRDNGRKSKVPLVLGTIFVQGYLKGFYAGMPVHVDTTCAHGACTVAVSGDRGSEDGFFHLELRQV
jgi:hypothetical protein